MYEVGEKVIIKEWSEMEREFGLNSNGNIKCAGCFTKQMKCLCGKRATIMLIEGNQVWLDFGNKANNFAFSTDMIKKVEERKEFTKLDLKPGMILEVRNGSRFLYINGDGISVDGFILLGSYKDDLTCPNPAYDIVKVYEQNVHGSLEHILKFGHLIWKREPKVKQLTTEELIDLLKAKFPGYDKIVVK